MAYKKVLYVNKKLNNSLVNNLIYPIISFKLTIWLV